MLGIKEQSRYNYRQSRVCKDYKKTVGTLLCKIENLMECLVF